jgi:hypothetical protein
MALSSSVAHGRPTRCSCKSKLAAACRFDDGKGCCAPGPRVHSISSIVASYRPMLDQRPTANECPSADEDGTAEDLVPIFAIVLVSKIGFAICHYAIWLRKFAILKYSHPTAMPFHYFPSHFGVFPTWTGQNALEGSGRRSPQLSGCYDCEAQRVEEVK